jgi:hypothetical protein
MKYSKPSALLNRYFKGNKKFIFTTDNQGLDCYENPDFRLVWMEGERFLLEKRMFDHSVGADWYEETKVIQELESLVGLIRDFYKNFDNGKAELIKILSKEGIYV